MVNGAPQDMLSFKPGLSQEEMLRRIDELGMLIEFIAVTEREYVSSQLPSYIFYNREWKSVLVAAIDIPESFLGAFLYHELGHAKKDRVDHAASSMQETDTDLWVSEEVEMHTLEGEVLNRASGGQLFKLYEAIIARAGTDEVNKVLLTLAEKDMQEYERMFDLEGMGLVMYSYCLTQFVTGLSFAAVDHVANDATQRERLKIDAYRFIAKRYQ